MLNSVDLNIKPNEIRLYLCLPSKETITELHSAFNKKYALNYGGINSLTFSLPYKAKSNMEFIRNPDIDLINGDYLIRFEDGYKIEYFIITKYKNNSNNGLETMDVETQYLPYEMKYKVVQSYKETKPLYDFIDTNSVLHDTLLAKSDWKIGYIDTTAAIQYRTFDVSNSTLLDFMNQLANTYNLIVTFDTVAKTVSFYREEDYGIDEDLVINEKYLKSLEENENHDDIVTRLYCYGKDNMTFASANPAGSNFIEDLSYYMYPFEQDDDGTIISHSQFMSDDLCLAILAYNQLLESKKGQLDSLFTQRNALVQSKIPLDVQLDQYKQELELILKNIDVNIRTGNSLVTLNSQKDAKQVQIDGIQSQIDSIDGQIATIDAQIINIRNAVSITANFTAAQIIERQKFIKEKVWIDTKYIDPNDLYNDGIKRLKMVSQPIMSYSISSVNFLRALNTPRDWNRLHIGSIVTVRYENFGINFEVKAKTKLNQNKSKLLKAKVTVITIDYESNTIDITIANKKDIKSGFLKFGDLLRSNVSTSATLDFNKDVWAKGKDANDAVTELLNNSWDANKRAIESGDNENYTLDKRGLTLKDPNDPMNYLRAVHNVLAITNDGGNSYKNAITSTGVVAERLYGQIIAGNNLVITNNSGTFTFNNAGATISGAALTITGGLPDGQIASSTAWNQAITTANNSVQNGVAYNGVVISSTSGIQVIDSNVKTLTTLNATNGITIAKNTGTTNSPLWSNQFYADSNGNLNITGAITATSGSFTGAINATSGTFNGIVKAQDLQLNGVSILVGNQINGNYINQIKTDQLVAGSAKISTALIQDLVVGGNVTMGPSATISWSNVNSKPDYDTPITNAQNSADAAKTTANGAVTVANSIANGSYSGGTFISNRFIYSPTIMTGTSGRYLKLEGSELQSVNSSTRDGFTLDGSSGYLQWYTNGSNMGGIFRNFNPPNEQMCISHHNWLGLLSSGYSGALNRIDIQADTLAIGINTASNSAATFYQRVNFNNPVSFNSSVSGITISSITGLEARLKNLEDRAFVYSHRNGGNIVFDSINLNGVDYVNIT